MVLEQCDMNICTWKLIIVVKFNVTSFRSVCWRVINIVGIYVNCIWIRMRLFHSETWFYIIKHEHKTSRALETIAGRAFLRLRMKLCCVWIFSRKENAQSCFVVPVGSESLVRCCWWCDCFWDKRIYAGETIFKKIWVGKHFKILFTSLALN